MWPFWELFYPLPPLDQCWILCWWSNLCFCQHWSFQHWLGGEGGRDQFLTFMWSENSMMRSFFIAFLALKWIKMFFLIHELLSSKSHALAGSVSELSLPFDIVDLWVKRTMWRHVCAFSTPRSLLIFSNKKPKQHFTFFKNTLKEWGKNSWKVAEK